MNRKKIYKALARKYGVPVSEIEQEMRQAIYLAYINPTAAAELVPREEREPSPQELIAYVAEKVNY